MHRPVLAGRGQRDLAFQIEMLLPADPHHADRPVRRGGQRGGAVAAAEHIVGQHRLVARERVLDGDARRLGLDHHGPQPGGAAGGVAGQRRDGKDRLPAKQHLAGREQRLVPQRRGNVVAAGHIGGGDHRDDTRRGPDGGQIDRRDAAAGHRRTADGQMQQAGGLGQVIDIGRRALDVLGGAVMRQRLAHMAQRCCIDHRIGREPLRQRHRAPRGSRRRASRWRARRQFRPSP